MFLWRLKLRENDVDLNYSSVYKNKNKYNKKSRFKPLRYGYCKAETLIKHARRLRTSLSWNINQEKKNDYYWETATKVAPGTQR